MPKTIAELYKDASEAMLARGGASSADLRLLMQAVFFEAHLAGQREITESQLEKAAQRAGVSSKVLVEFIDRAKQDKLPLVSLLTVEPLVLRSSHLSFQEYFVARAMCEEGIRNQRLPQEPLWQWPAWWDNMLTIGEGMGKDFNKGLLYAIGLKDGSGTLDLSGKGLGNLRLGDDRPMAVRVRAVCLLLQGLTNVDLAGNGIGLEGGRAIGNALRANCSLTSLDLHNCFVGKEIAEALKVTGLLTEIDLQGNDLGDEGWCVIFDALHENKENKVVKWELSGQGISSTIAYVCSGGHMFDAALDYLAFRGSLCVLELSIV